MSAMVEEEVPEYRLYNNEQGAARISGGEKVVRASTLGRLARTGKVTHTRVGRKVLWTDAQLRAAVAYLATQTRAKPIKKASPPPEPPRPRRGEIVPLVAKPGRRYSNP
ncbi:hypothetical protein [Microtetraspora niveoalba]|uniref:hypothetical protein n=1 Tax=Microtetraspora niveoalba TaxID=46175 RepID=UPI00082A205B|nr:hypothetical protein [Microtetraspora niveoalba]